MDNDQIKKIDAIHDMISDLKNDFFDNSMIIDNKSYFEFNNESYRSTMPSPRDLNTADKLKIKVYGTYIQMDGFMLRDNLIKDLKERHNIDIEKMEEEKQQLLKDLKFKFLELSELGQTVESDRITKLREELLGIRTNIIKQGAKIEMYLEPCIENKVTKTFYDYLTYACTEICVDKQNDVWEKAWNEFEDFESDKSGLPNQALACTQELILDSRKV